MYAGLYISASGVLTNMYRQDVLANNLANVETIGFKPDVPMHVQRHPAAIEDGLGHLPSNRMLERLGGGVLMAPIRANLAQGAIQPTGNPTDLAIRGEGFFMVSQGTGSNDERLRLTRDGRFTLDTQGRLVTASDGLVVLDTNDRAITLDRTTTFTVSADGTIRQDGSPVARLQVVTVPGAESCEKGGAGLLKLSASQIASRRETGAQVAQGAVERSGVDPVRAMMGVTEASNAIANNARMIQLFDELLARTIHTFGKVA